MMPSIALRRLVLEYSLVHPCHFLQKPSIFINFQLVQQTQLFFWCCVCVCVCVSVLARTHLDANDVVFTCCHCGVICRLLHQGGSALQTANDVLGESSLPVVECHIEGCDGNGVSVARRAIARRR